MASKLARINKNVMTSLISAQLVILVGYVMQMAVSHSGKTIVDVLIAFGIPMACNLVTIFYYFKNKESAAIRNLCMLSLLLFLAIALFLRHNPIMYVVGFPLFVAFGYYNDYKFTLFGCLSLLAINLVAMAYYIIVVPGYLQQDISAVLFQLFTHIFFVFTLPNSVKFVNEEHSHSVALQQKRADETSLLLEHSNKTTDLIKSIMENTGESVRNLTQHSQKMSDSAESLRGGSESGKQRIVDLTEMMAAFRERAVQDAERAERSCVLAEKSRVDAARSNEQMNGAILAIQNIQTVSNEIGNINKTIDSIAFQTNILALNAAVEAARAGQYGKGFAVVAEEVRSLSNRSAVAATETERLIERAQTAIASGSSEISASAQALHMVQDNAQNMMELSRSIVESGRAQQQMAHDVMRLIDNLRELLHSTSDTADENLDISRMIQEEAQSLSQLIVSRTEA